jgi:long-chain acyl-CoA synthetase
LPYRLPAGLGHRDIRRFGSLRSRIFGQHSDARFAIVNDQEQTDKLIEIHLNLPLLQKVIYWDPKGLKNYNDPLLVSFTDVIKMGKKYEKDNPGQFEKRLSEGKADDIAFIIIPPERPVPKGACLSHRAPDNYSRSSSTLSAY